MTLDDKTNVSFYTILSVIPFVIAGVVWVSSIASIAQESKILAAVQEKRLDGQRDAIKDDRLLLLDIRDRLARIEAHLGIK